MIKGKEDTHGGGFIRVHLVITRALKVSRDMVQGGYLPYLNNFVDPMCVHPRGEDQVVLSYLEFNQVVAVSDKLEMDHKALDAFLFDIDQRTESYRWRK